MVLAENIDFSYGKKPTLHDVSMHLQQGSLCGILGANGSGKTTLMKCLLGFLPLQQGKIAINGKNLQSMPQGKRAKQVAYVPQDTKQYSTLTVFETILLGRKPYFSSSPLRRDVKIAAEIMADMELEDLAMQNVNQLSGGQRQRVCIAKALCQQTPIIMLDEPTANLDIRYKIDVMRILQRLAGQGKTILFTVHDISIPHAFCTDVVLLKNGEKLAQGGREVLTRANVEHMYDIDYDDINELLNALQLA